MSDLIDRVARAMFDKGEKWCTIRGQNWETAPTIQKQVLIAQAKVAIATLREPTHAITRAMAESRARDDEGDFPIMLDLLDFSGENKAHTVLAQAWRDGIDAVLRDL